MLRGKRKYISDYTTADIYRDYRNIYKGTLSKKEFSHYYKVIIDFILKKVLNDSEEYIFPFRLGTFRIKRTKYVLKTDENNKVITNGLKIDFKSSWNLWHRQYPNLTDKEIINIKGKKNIYFLNEHSNGYYNKFYWDKRTCVGKNQSVFKLYINRDRKRDLAFLSKQNKIYYE